MSVIANYQSAEFVHSLQGTKYTSPTYARNKLLNDPFSWTFLTRQSSTTDLTIIPESAGTYCFESDLNL